MQMRFMGVLAMALLCMSCSDQLETQSSTPAVRQFDLLPSDQTGINFSNTLTPSYEQGPFNFDYFYNGAGVAVGDINGDQLPDIYFVGNMVPDKLYVNKGNMQFEEVAQSFGIEDDLKWRNGVTMVDVNGDGWLDIYICRGGFVEDTDDRRNLLYINQSGKGFVEKAREYGLDYAGYSTQAYFFDADRDNDLDVLILNRPNRWWTTEDEWDLAVKNAHHYSKDRFLIQEDGRFTDVSEEAGFDKNFGYSLSASISDLNNDGLPDIYIANDYNENDYYYENQGEGRFKEKISSLVNHTPYYAMGSDFKDLNNDGFDEGVVVEMLPKDYKRAKTTMMPMMQSSLFEQLFGKKYHYQYMHNALYANMKNGFLSDVAYYSGITSTDWSWSVLIQDFDHDGWKDFYVTNGYRHDFHDRDSKGAYSEALKQIIDPNKVDLVGKTFRQVYHPENLKKDLPPIQQIIDILPTNPISNVAFWNKGNLQFEDVSGSWGLDELSFSNGAATGDLDGDGDLDLVVNNIDKEAFIFENNLASKPALSVRLNGPGKNTFGVGAKVKACVKDRCFWEAQYMSRGYLSSIDPIIFLSLPHTEIETLEITWPDGSLQTINGPFTDRHVVVDYSPQSPSEKLEFETEFEEITAHVFAEIPRHEENYFDDFFKQVLLPHEFSEEGPALAVGDVNGDKLPDLYVGGSFGLPGRLFFQSADGTFTEKTPSVIHGDSKYEDCDAEFLDADGDGDLDLYVVSGGMEFDLQSDGYQDRLYENVNGKFTKKVDLPLMNISGLVVKSKDIDRDGIPEIFVGAGPLRDLYPYPNSSFVLKNFEGEWKDITSGSFPGLKDFGIVRCAAWANLDGQGTDELILAGEWTPISVFSYNNGRFENVTQQLGLGNSSGWWFGLEASDIDKDGDIDLLVGNLGLNYKFSASAEKPFEVYSSDFDSNGTYDVVLAKHLDNKRLVPIRGKDCTSEQMPYIRDAFPTFNEFANADISELLQQKDRQALHMKVTDFESGIFVNNGQGKFIKKRLPAEVQWSTARGFIVRDFDKDGMNDVLVAGNMFQSEPETSRADASAGWFLKGLANLDFQVLYPGESGFFAPGDVRDMEPIQSAESDLIAVVNNSGPVQVFKVK